MSNQRFNDAKERLIITAQRVAGNYLLSKYGQARLIGEPTVELTSTVDPISSGLSFSGKITVSAAGVLNNVNVDMTVNSNEIEVDSETSVQSKIESAVNAQQEQEPVKASLDGFKLTDNGTMYLKVSHSDLQDASLGIVGKNEYATSPNRAELLQSIVKDAMLETPITFVGEFKEPTIEKKAEFQPKTGEPCSCRKGMERDNCPRCEGTGQKIDFKKVREVSKKEASVSAKATWLTAELFKDAEDIEKEAAGCDQCAASMINGVFCHETGCPNKKKQDRDEDMDVDSSKHIAIKEDMPMAKAADHLAQSAQLEEQSGLAAQAKVEHEAANALMALLQGQGYGSAKIVESSRSNDGFDFMTAIDDAGSVKAVSIPVTIKEGKVVLPKKSLISTLISKGLDVKAKLAEQFDMDVLEKLAAIEEKIAYEANEVVSILNENLTVEKIAAGEKQPFFDSDDSTMTVNKHMLPNHEDYKVGDKISDGTDQYEIVNQDGQQNDKNEGSSSQWTLKKCQDPERDDKKVKNQIPS